MTVSRGSNGKRPSNYVPALLGNGNICLLIGQEGGQKQTEYFDYGKYFGSVLPMIWWAGRRYDDPLRKLIPFGHFETEMKMGKKNINQAAKAAWEQELNVDKGLVRTLSTYDEMHVLTSNFVTFDHNLVVVHKEVKGDHALANLELLFRYILHSSMKEHSLPAQMRAEARWDSEQKILQVHYRIDDSRNYQGVVLLFSDVEVEARIEGNRFELRSRSPKNFEANFFLLLMDNQEATSYLEEAIELARVIKKDGYQRVLQKHLKDWERFWSRSYINLPDKDLVSIWKTCLYHIRSSATKWSIPTGILETHWWGKFFFDEIFAYLALVSSNHIKLAERVPKFRLQTLSKALEMTKGAGARYPWESTEQGDEASPPGPWRNEVHLMAIIASECWTHYLYTQDLEFLRQIYPVIKECAEYLRQWHVYELSEDKAVIGACTDLDEALFPVRNPLYTLSGTIHTLRIASQASQILGLDEDLPSIWRELARKLENTLPCDGEKYIPFEGASHQSLGCLGIVFPFCLLSPQDPIVRKTIFDFMNRCRTLTGWRPSSHKDFYLKSIMGEKMEEKESWIWNSAWLATCLARMEEGELFHQVFEKIKPLTDAFGSLSEVKTSKQTLHHWFVTAAGSYVYALNEALVQSSPEEIRILPAVPRKWDEISFKLSCQGNVKVEIKFSQGRVRQLCLSSSLKQRRRIVIPEGLVGIQYQVSGGKLACLGTKDKKTIFEAKFKGSFTIKFK